MASAQTNYGVNASDEVLRRRLIGVAATTAILATLHFADHVIRGQLVLDRGLDPAWNHSGWPFQPRFSPFTVSLVLVYGLLLGGIVLTLRARAWAGYWLVTAVLLGGIVTQVHFGPGPNTESSSVIIDSYGTRAVGVFAVIIVFAVAAALVVMAAQAIWSAASLDAGNRRRELGGDELVWGRLDGCAAPVGSCSSAPPAGVD